MHVEQSEWNGRKNADQRKTSQIMRFRFLQTPSSKCSSLRKIFLAFFFRIAFTVRWFSSLPFAKTKFKKCIPFVLAQAKIIWFIFYSVFEPIWFDVVKYDPKPKILNQNANWPFDDSRRVVRGLSKCLLNAWIDTPSRWLTKNAN